MGARVAALSVRRTFIVFVFDFDDGKGTEAWGIPKEGYLQYSWM